MYVLKAKIDEEVLWFPLYEGGKNYILGSKDTCDFHLPYKGVSREHCEFFLKKGEWWIKDLDSTNGTYLDGEIIKEAKLKEKSTIICGTVQLIVMESPSNDWITRDGKKGLTFLAKEDLETRKRKTDEFYLKKEGYSIYEKICEILFSDLDYYEKIEKFNNLLKIENVEVLYKDEQKEILLFKKTSLINKELYPIKGTISEIEIRVFPKLEDKLEYCASVFFSIFSFMRLGTKFLSQEKEIGEKIDYAILGVSEFVKGLWEKVYLYKDSDLPILITGETGIGKEFLAKEIHKISKRGGKPFIPVSFSEKPDSLKEAEIFGIEEKVATGVKGQIGVLEQANNGCILIDEVGDMPKEWQLMLLRVIENNYFYKIGGKKPIPINVRFIFTTNKDIDEQVKIGAIREDFYYRIKGVHLHIIPLRERKEDLEYFAQKILDELNLKYNSKVVYSFSAFEKILKYCWPGNIRQLKLEIEKAFHMAKNIGIIQEKFLTIGEIESTKPNIIPFKEAIENKEKEILLKAIKFSKNISEAIEKLKIPRTTFYQKVKKYKIDLKKFKEKM